jgi:hypothetical protein
VKAASVRLLATRDHLSRSKFPVSEKAMRLNDQQAVKGTIIADLTQKLENCIAKFGSRPHEYFALSSVHKLFYEGFLGNLSF